MGTTKPPGRGSGRGARERLSRLSSPGDLALAAGLAVGAAGESWSVGWMQVVLCAATALSVLARRRQPLVSTALVAFFMAAASVLAESPDQISVLLAVLVSAFSVAGWANTREALVGLAFLGVSLAAAIALDPSDSLANILPTLVLFVGLPGGLGFAFSRKRQEVRRADAAAATALEAEQRRIARELHDVVSHAVTLIAVQAEAGRSLLDRDPAAAARAFESIGTASRDALAELQTLLSLLRSEPDQTGMPVGLEGLPALLDGARASGMPVELAVTGRPGWLDAEADRCAYRVIQEGLTNALRHMRSPSVRIEVTHDHTDVAVRVTSSGHRHQSAYGGSGLGLRQLEERVANLGGRLTSGSTAADTFVLDASLPRSNS